MPEQISKHPDVTIQVLKGAGARCGPGVQKTILKQCPSERFCALPTGEICVYGLDQIPQMTQITMKELALVVCPAAKRSAWGFDADAIPDPMALGATLVLGLAVGRLWRRNQ